MKIFFITLGVIAILAIGFIWNPLNWGKEKSKTQETEQTDPAKPTAPTSGTGSDEVLIGSCPYPFLYASAKDDSIRIINLSKLNKEDKKSLLKYLALGKKVWLGVDSADADANGICYVQYIHRSDKDWSDNEQNAEIEYLQEDHAKLLALVNKLKSVQAGHSVYLGVIARNVAALDTAVIVNLDIPDTTVSKNLQQSFDQLKKQVDIKKSLGPPGGNIKLVSPGSGRG